MSGLAVVRALWGRRHGVAVCEKESGRHCIKPAATVE